MRHRTVCSGARVLAILLALVPAGAARANPFSFSCISNQSASDCGLAEAQLSLLVSDPGGGQVRFDLSNSDAGVFTVAQIYFDDGSLGSFASVVNGPGVNMVLGPAPGPGDLPAGADADPPFEATVGFLTRATAPPSVNGVGAGETVGMIFNLVAGQTVADVIAELESGEIRVGVHAIAFTSGGSESLITPEPRSALLVGLGLLAVAGLRRGTERARD